jgi:hypothetical protein
MAARHDIAEKNCWVGVKQKSLAHNDCEFIDDIKQNIQPYDHMEVLRMIEQVDNDGLTRGKRRDLT